MATAPIVVGSTQIAIGALGIVAIVARDGPNAGYLGFIVLSTGVTIAAPEIVRRRRTPDTEVVSP